MIQFAYSFCMAMLHSLWQAALLYLLYAIANKVIHKHNAPIAKRNFLYLAITTQLFLFIITFLICLTGAEGFGGLTNSLKTIKEAIDDNGFAIITPWIFGLYLVIITAKISMAVYGWLSFKKQYMAGLQKPAVELKLFTELKAYQFGIKRKVKLWLSTSIHTPVTFGYFKPVILLPVALLSNISTSQAETLILHELTHIRTNDYLLNWFLVAAETIFFFNPFVTSLCRQIKLEREKNCDIHVLSFKYPPVLYAETLLQAEKLKQLAPAFQLAAVNHKKQLLQRIQFFSSEKVLAQTLRFNIVVPLIGLVLLFLLSAALLFQSQSTSAQLQFTTGVHFIPSGENYILTNTEFPGPVTTSNLSNKPAGDDMVKEKDLPESPEKKDDTNTGEPMICKPAPEEPEEIITGPDINFARPITTLENDAAKQIIITEESSGNATVKSYYLVFANGKWVLQPDWTVTANKICTDSLQSKHDSSQKSLKKTYPDQQ